MKPFLQSPQQTLGSIDYGAIICDIIATIFQYGKISNKCDAEKVRVNVVHILLNKPVHPVLHDSDTSMIVTSWY